MSARHWKRTRNALRPYQRDIDRRERRKYRPPWWARVLDYFYVTAPARWHRERWERRHQAGLRHALKSVSHQIIKTKEAPRG